MRRIGGWLLAGWVLVAGASVASADEHPVVVELFTSQGCSSCPPADAFLADLAERDDVIALALHVDYWDYIGWKDSFAQPAFTARQKAYAHAAGHNSIYTPQMIVGGADHVMGARPMAVIDLIRAHAEAPRKVSLGLERAAGAKVAIEVEAVAPVGAAQVHFVRYRPHATVKITRGENAGRTLAYSNIVTRWTVLARWDGQTPLRLLAEAPGDQPVVVLVQDAGDGDDQGAVLAAARLR
ncbi:MULTISPECIES: DUF1223 domain-containing protein [unclassified Rhodosalinus]|uniref:DUF1223 domain-containing protein n=1 Tax=unclassified Rhodosalinus TaxID=2630183 RepID=UPI00352391C3